MLETGTSVYSFDPVELCKRWTERPGSYLEYLASCTKRKDEPGILYGILINAISHCNKLIADETSANFAKEARNDIISLAERLRARLHLQPFLGGPAPVQEVSSGGDKGQPEQG